MVARHSEDRRPATGATPNGLEKVNPLNLKSRSRRGESIVTAQKRAEKVLGRAHLNHGSHSESTERNCPRKILRKLQGVIPGVNHSVPAARLWGVLHVIRGIPIRPFLEDYPLLSKSKESTSIQTVDSGLVLTGLLKFRLVRGSAGTLKGAQRTAGALLFLTADPGRLCGRRHGSV